MTQAQMQQKMMAQQQAMMMAQQGRRRGRGPGRTGTAGTAGWPTAGTAAGRRCLSRRRWRRMGPAMMADQARQTAGGMQ